MASPSPIATTTVYVGRDPMSGCCRVAYCTRRFGIVGMVTRVAPIAALLALTLAACGGSGTKSSSPTTSSSPSTASDLQQAGAAYQKTLSIIDSASFANLGKARDAGDGAAMLGAASNYRNVVFTWDAAVRAISFPSAVQPQVN